MKQRSALTGNSGLQVRIRVGRHLEAGWSSWFEGLAVTPLDGGETSIHGTVADQSSLHGLLSRIRDLGVPLLALEVTDATGGLDADAAGGGQGSSDPRPTRTRAGSSAQRGEA